MTNAANVPSLERTAALRKRRRRYRSQPPERRAEWLAAGDTVVKHETNQRRKLLHWTNPNAGTTRSLPILVELRRSGKSSSIWRTRISHNVDNDTRTKSWRPYACQSVPFSRIGTPPMDAVLALERNGSYVVSLGGRTPENRSSDEHKEKQSPVLSLRFYATPSPASLMRSGRSKTPLVRTIPLLMETNDPENNRNYSAPSTIFGDSFSSPAATTPVQVLLSSDSALGVAFLHHSTSSFSSVLAPPLSNLPLGAAPTTRDEDTLGTLVLFSLPGTRYSGIPKRGWGTRKRQLTQSYRCSNVRVGAWGAFTMRNLLWKIECIPNQTFVSKNEDSLCNSVSQMPGYLLFNDEDDGYRITWVVTGGWNERKASCPVQPVTKDLNFPIQPARRDIVTCSEEQVWDEHWCDSLAGFSCDSEPHTGKDLEIAFEAYLRMDSLLSDILTRRKKLFQSHGISGLENIDFHYNLISVTGSGRSVCLVIVFAHESGNHEPAANRRAACGVVLCLDLMTQWYKEIEWVKHPVGVDNTFLRQWSNTLALNYRMRELRVGPFCVGDYATAQLRHRNLGIIPLESNFDLDEAEAFNPEIWRSYVNELLSGEAVAESIPKQIGFSCLYPDCDLITNRAVISLQPVSCIACRNSSMRLVYG